MVAVHKHVYLSCCSLEDPTFVNNNWCTVLWTWLFSYNNLPILNLVLNPVTDILESNIQFLDVGRRRG